MLGDTGTAQPLLLLAAALERAKPGDLILLAGYGDGADACLLRATDAIARYRHGAQRVLADRGEAPAAVVRHVRALPPAAAQGPAGGDLSTPVVPVPRSEERCCRCTAASARSAAPCSSPSTGSASSAAIAAASQDIKLARRGTLFTFTNDYMFDSPDTPVAHAVVDLDGGGRVYVQLTDCDPERVEIDMPVELTFRKYHEGSAEQLLLEGAAGFKPTPTIWKARPA